MKNNFSYFLMPVLAIGMIFNIGIIYNGATASQNLKEQIALASSDKGESDGRVVAYIRTQADLDGYLKKTGRNMSDNVLVWENNEKITWPAGIYTSSDRIQWLMPAGFAGNIEMRGVEFYLNGGGSNSDRSFTIFMKGDQKGRTISGLKAFGTASGNKSNLSIAGAGLNFALYKVQNAIFDDLHFYNTNKMSWHTFDIMGSNNVEIKNSTFAGYGGFSDEFTDAEMTAAINLNSHRIGAESIQVDTMYAGGAGWDEARFNQAKAENWWSVRLLEKSDFDNTPSSNITVKNNYFGKYSGVDGNGDQVVRVYGATVGSHARNTYESIEISGNIFENTIAPSKDAWAASNSANNSDRFHYPLKMLYTTSSVSRLIKLNKMGENIFIGTRSDWKYPSGVPGSEWIGYYGSDLSTALQLGEAGLILEADGAISAAYYANFEEKINLAGGLRAKSVVRATNGDMVIELLDGEKIIWRNFGAENGFLAAVKNTPAQDDVVPVDSTRPESVAAAEIKAPNTGFLESQSGFLLLALSAVSVLTALGFILKRSF